jgi:Flp pilus assembly pilin Flp
MFSEQHDLTAFLQIWRGWNGARPIGIIIAMGHHARGQGMTEYIIIVALVAISSIAAVTIFGDDVKVLFGMSSDALSGEVSVAARGREGGVDRRTLKTYGENSATSGSSGSSGGSNPSPFAKAHEELP